MAIFFKLDRGDGYNPISEEFVVGEDCSAFGRGEEY